MVRSGDHVRGGQFAEEFRQGTVPFRSETPGTAFSHDLALVNDHGAGAGSIDFLEDVSREDDGLFLAKFADQLPDFVFLVGVEAIGGFIEDENFGVMKEGLCQARAMPVSLGEGNEGLVPPGLQEAGFDHAVDSFFPGQSGESPDAGAEAEKTENRHIGIEGGGLGEVSDLPFGVLRLICNRDPADFHVAMGGGEKSGDDPHGGGFPGTVRTEESKDFTLLYREGEVIDSCLVTKLLSEIIDFDHEW